MTNAANPIGRMREKLRRKALKRRDQAAVLDALASDTLPQSVLFFTHKKCASSFVGKLFKTLLEDSAYAAVDYEQAAWDLGDQFPADVTPFNRFLSDHHDRLLYARGFVYAPLRTAVQFPGIDRFKHVFFLRDPRDMAVSDYYSVAYSHPAPLNSARRVKFEERRKQLRETGIDDFARESARKTSKGLLRKYRTMREAAPDALYLTYAEFATDTAQFVRRLAAFLDIPVDDNTIDALVAEADPVQSTTDKSRHKRSGASGQYLTELAPETVEFMNRELAEMLVYWGFEKGPGVGEVRR